MKIVVIGGTGLIGSKLVATLRNHGHEVLAAAPGTGVNTITREGLAEAMDGAQVVVDVANAPAWDDQAVLEFFETSGRNLLAAEAAAGVRHHVALSIVGSERNPDNGYFRAKVAQENLIKASGIPYTIVRAPSSTNSSPASPRRPSSAMKSACRPHSSRPLHRTTWWPRWPTSRRQRQSTARSRSPARRPCRLDKIQSACSR